MKQSIKRFESMVFFVRQTQPGPCVFSLCYFLEMPFVISDLLSSTPFAADKQRHAWPRSLPNHITQSLTGIKQKWAWCSFRIFISFSTERFRKIKPKITRELRKHSLNKINIIHSGTFSSTDSYSFINRPVSVSFAGDRIPTIR